MVFEYQEPAAAVDGMEKARFRCPCSCMAIAKYNSFYKTAPFDLLDKSLGITSASQPNHFEKTFVSDIEKEGFLSRPTRQHAHRLCRRLQKHTP